MPNTIAFFPWVSLHELVIVDPVRLIPYERCHAPADGPHVAQSDIDGVLKAYGNRKDELVHAATLLEVGDWKLGQVADSETRGKLFRARELVGFSALAKRQLFRGHFDYCNFDTYSFVIQNYVPGNSARFSFDTRHRDGTANRMWASDEFAFFKPLHVESNALIKIDETFLAALLAADAAGKLPYDAIVEFDRANTDSDDVPTHIEIVLAKSAFEYLFDISQNVPDFVEALRKAVPERDPQTNLSGPLAQRWKDARPKAARPLEAWAREFCDIRGGAAHGAQRNSHRFVWSEEAHLAFVSILFPLLMKQRLAHEQFLTVGERDALELAWIEDYLMHDPFAPEQPDRAVEHPWSKVYSYNILGEVMRRGIARSADQIDWSNMPSDETPDQTPDGKTPL
jgi:hypothetical protein